MIITGSVQTMQSLPFAAIIMIFASFGNSFRLSMKSDNIILFHPYSLRLHDNPCLRNRHFDDSTIGLYIKDSKLETQFGIESEIDLCLLDLQNRLNNKLKILQGDTCYELQKYIQSIQSSTSPKVYYCRSPIDPFLSMNSKLETMLNDLKINHAGFYDDLTNELPIKTDLVYKQYESFYHHRKNVPKPITTFINNQPSLITSSYLNDNADSLTGESKALYLLREYISLGDNAFSIKYYNQYIETMARSDEQRKSLQRLVTANRISSTKYSLFYGEVFSGIMSRYLAMGCISPRLLYWARSSTFTKVPEYSIERPLACRVKDEAIRRDWHYQLAKKTTGQSSSNKGSWNVLFSSWNGYTQREMHPLTHDDSKPILVFVHGFGGSFNQFTDLGFELIDQFNCYGLDLIGFGYSEKPPLSYNQYQWRDQVCDFIEKIVEDKPKSTVIIAGNSIGGYTATSAIAKISNDHRYDKINIGGLVLMNSAGEIYDPSEYAMNISSTMTDSNLFSSYDGPNAEILQLVGKGIFALLQPNIRRLCEWLYPTDPARVIAYRGQNEASHVNSMASSLVDSIYRDSCDMGATDVIASGAKLPPPRPMNNLLSIYNGPVLIAQGILDQLNDVKSRAIAFERIRNGITVDMLNLGHCPMDENPSMVANSIRNWYQTISASIPSQTVQARQSETVNVSLVK